MAQAMLKKRRITQDVIRKGMDELFEEVETYKTSDTSTNRDQTRTGVFIVVWS